MQQSKDHSERRPRTALIHSARFLGVLAWVIALLLGSAPGFWTNWAVQSAQAAQPDGQVAIPAGGTMPIRGNSPAAPGLAVVKSVVAPAGRTTFYTGETVKFQVVVENTGDTTISYLPQLDEYGPECLEFIPKASPAESSSFAGLIEWYDLTFVTGVDLAPGEQFITTMNFLVTGPTTGNSATSYNTATVRGALDAEGTLVPEAHSTIDFSCAARPSVAVDKAFVTPQNRTVLLTGETVSFSVVITNTGATTLGYIPLLDTYDASCLEFISKASPAESTSGTGIIEWYDLTFVNGQDLPPGQAFLTTMSFLVTGPTTGATEPGNNTALVSGALDVFNSPTLDQQDSVQYTCAAPASIGDYVWHDVDGDGLQDEGPGAGLDGVTVRLYQDDGDGIFEPGGDDVLLDTQVTAGDGLYLFDMLHAGDYWVDVDQTTVPPTMVLTVGTDPRLVTVAYGEAYRAADFGYARTGILVEKTATPAVIHNGDLVTYYYKVTNPGEVPLASVSVTDDKCSPVIYQGGDTDGNDRLDPGEEWTYICTQALTEDIVNTATATGQPTRADGQPLPNVRDDDTAAVDVLNPGIRIVKSGPAVSFVGATALFTYTVTNAGDTPLAAVAVSDDICGAATYQSGDADGNDLLGLSEIWVFECSYLVKSTDHDPLVNIATVTGADALGRTVSDSDRWSTDLFTVRLGDFVWEDDGDGVQEPSETTGIANVPIHITGVNALGNAIDIIVLTSATGSYGVDLLPGTYTVTADMVFGAYVRSSPGAFTVTLSSDVREDLTLDFGYVRPTGVQLVDFNLLRSEAAVRLIWEIALPAATTEAPLFGVYRAVPGGAWKRLTPALLAPISQDDVRALYDFTDSLAEPGQRYLYQLRSAAGETFGPWQTDLPVAGHHFYLPFVRR